MDERDEPDVVIFCATGDVLSALFTLSNFDELNPNAAIAPFGAGCATVTHYPYLENDRDRPSLSNLEDS